MQTTRCTSRNQVAKCVLTMSSKQSVNTTENKRRGAFFSDSFNELRRVTWPSREETIRLSIMVIVVASIIGTFLGIFDLLFSKLFDVILGN